MSRSPAAICVRALPSPPERAAASANVLYLFEIDKATLTSDRPVQGDHPAALDAADESLPGTRCLAMSSPPQSTKAGGKTGRDRRPDRTRKSFLSAEISDLIRVAHT